MADSIGAKIKDVRTQQGLTLKDVAERADLSVSYISDIERGRTSLSALESLMVIATALNTDVISILSDVPGMNTNPDALIGQLYAVENLITQKKSDIQHLESDINVLKHRRKRIIARLLAMGHDIGDDDGG